MNDLETLVIMGILKAAYPRYYANIKPIDAENAAALWAESFACYPAELVTYAVKSLIISSPYPPAISDVIKRIESATRSGEDSDAELWNKLYAAICDSAYNASERFAELPRECREFAGSPAGLRELGQTDADILNTVTRGQFLKQIPTIRQRYKERAAMPPAIRELVSGMSKQEALPGPQEPLSDSEWVKRRDRLIASVGLGGTP